MDLEKIKEMFFNGKCGSYALEKIEKENGCKIEQSIIISWVKEYCDNLFLEINKMIDSRGKNESQKYVEEVWNLTWRLYARTDYYKLDYFYERLVALTEKINYDEYLLVSQVYRDPWDREIFISNFWIQDDDTLYDPHFVNDGSFNGLLPRLYNLNRLDLFYRLFDIILNLISDFGYECERLIVNTHNYLLILNNQELMTKFNDCIRNWLENTYFEGFYSLVHNFFIMDVVQNVHFDKEKELYWIKKTYCWNKVFAPKSNYYNSLIYNALDYYGIDRSILNDWDNNLVNYLFDELKNMDELLDLSFVDKKKHSNYYIEFLKEKYKMHGYTILVISIYLMASIDIKDDRSDLISKNLYDCKDELEIISYDHSIKCFKDILKEKILNEDMTEGYLIKYYNNKKYFDIYMQLAFYIIDTPNDKYALRIEEFKRKNGLS